MSKFAETLGGQRKAMLFQWLHCHLLTGTLQEHWTIVNRRFQKRLGMEYAVALWVHAVHTYLLWRSKSLTV